MVEWVIEDFLARSCRPGYSGVDAETSQSEVDSWLGTLRRMGIKSILCLLADEQLAFCSELPNGLLEYYEDAGFQVVHIPVKDFQWPPLSAEQLEEVLVGISAPSQTGSGALQCRHLQDRVRGGTYRDG